MSFHGGRNSALDSDWDPMRNDFENSTYGAQTPEDEASGGVQLDHCRLYVTHIPATISEHGLKCAFKKYGTVTSIYVNPDSSKRYALVTFETSGEAKLAMTNLNQADPLCLRISIAKAQSNNKHKGGDGSHGRMARGAAPAHRTSRLDDNSSSTSRERSSRSAVQANGDTESLADEMEVTDLLDGDEEDLDLKMEQLKMMEAKIRYERAVCLAAKKAAVAQASANKPLRYMTADRKIVVRSVANPVVDKNGGTFERDVPKAEHITAVYSTPYSDKLLHKSIDTEMMALGGDDSPPPLSNESLRRCVQCGNCAALFCSRCSVTPYCSPQCQRRDWPRRHSTVCHNLAAQLKPIDSATTTAVAPSSVNGDDQVNSFRGGPRSKPMEASCDRSARKDDEYEGPKLRQPNLGFKGRGNANFEDRRNQDDKRSFTPAARTPNADAKSGPGNDSHNKSDSRNKFENKGRSDNNNNGGRFENRAKLGNGDRGREQGRRPPLRHELNRAPHDEDSLETKPQVKSEVVKPEEKKLERAEAKSHVPFPVKVKEAGAPAAKCKETPESHLPELIAVDGLILLEAVQEVGGELVCLPLHTDHQKSYEALCDEYAVACESDATTQFSPTVGGLLSVLDAGDGGWYRARCLAPGRAALLDAQRVVSVTPDTRCRPLPPKYASVPEFSCVLLAKDAKVGSSFKCKVVSKSAKGDVTVALEDMETSASVGEGTLKRWRPPVELPKVVTPKLVPKLESQDVPTTSKPTTAASVTPGTPTLTAPPRPDVVDGAEVILVEVTSAERLIVRPADKRSQLQYDMLLQDAALAGLKAQVLVTPPLVGDLVLAKFTDDVHYRALCTRTSVKQNKYLLEYIEFGNIEKSSLERLYACPEELSLSAQPVLPTHVALHGFTSSVLTPAALEYLNALKDKAEPLTLTLLDGAKMAPDGSKVKLTLVKNRENVNQKVEAMSRPEWKKLEESGGDVLQSEILTMADLEYDTLPAEGGTMHILDGSTLMEGYVAACAADDPRIQHVFGKLTERITEYCDSSLGREPYMPRVDELCISKFPPYEQWFRAVLGEQQGGAGGGDFMVMYLDYGNMGRVGAADLRKMLPEFVRGEPVLASLLSIKDFPTNPSPAALEKAYKILGISEENPSGGSLKVTSCKPLSDAGNYIVTAPDLIKAITQ